MGHYSDCYDRDYEEIAKDRVKRVKELTLKYEIEIRKYGIAGFLARKEVYK